MTMADENAEILGQGYEAFNATVSAERSQSCAVRAHRRGYEPVGEVTVAVVSNVLPSS